MKTQRKMWMALAVIALGTSLSGCGLHGKPRVGRKAGSASATGSQPAATPAARNAGEEVGASAGAEIVAPGIVEPWGGEVELAAYEPGWIARILVREGDLVRRGQLLATLESEPQLRAVELSRAELAEATARAEFARASAARTLRLHADKSVPDNEADRARADALEQTAAAERAEASLRLAEANLARRRIEAPGPGKVLLSRFHAGEYYAPGEGPLFVLGDVSRLQIRLEVDEIDSPDVSLGASCTLVSDGGRLLGLGRIVRIAPKMGRRGLPLESPTARADVRVREVFVEVAATAPLVPGQRVWGHTPRLNERAGT